MKKIRLFCLGLFLYAAAGVNGADDVPESFFEKGRDGTLILHFIPGEVPEDLFRKSIEHGQKSEIYASFRIQAHMGGFLRSAGEHREVSVRLTGFKDKITGEYILLQNDRPVAVFSDWDSFFKRFSSGIRYSAGISFREDLVITVKERIIYKKLVPPFNIMYLLPGKFLKQSPWRPVGRRTP